MVVIFGAMKNQEQQQTLNGLTSSISIGLNTTLDAMKQYRCDQSTAADVLGDTDQHGQSRTH